MAHKMFSSDEIQIKVIVDDLETKEDKKLLLEAEIEIRKDIINVIIVYNDAFLRFLEPFHWIYLLN